jgi:nucleoporin p58/p45
MPGLNWDLNLTPDQQDLARRLSFSDADSAEPPRASRPLQRGRRSPSRYHHAAPKPPVLPSIKEGDIEGQDEETPVPVHPSRCAAPPLAPVTSSATLYPSQGGMPHPTSAPVTTPLVLAPPVPLESQPLQQVAVETTTSEYQRQLQAAMQQQQQGCVAVMQARALVEQLRLYTVAGDPVGYETKWEELHPVSQRLLLRIEYGFLRILSRF